MSALPWTDLLQVAARQLALPPQAFWALSLREWNAITGGLESPVISRAIFDELIAQYPDNMT